MPGLPTEYHQRADLERSPGRRHEIRGCLDSNKGRLGRIRRGHRGSQGGDIREIGPGRPPGKAVLRPGRFGREVQGEGPPDRHAEAAGSELAAAKYFDIPNFKLTINTFKKVADVGNRIEIKHTIWKEGHLIIRERDRIDDLAVLVTGKSPNYFIVGWLPISICKSDRFKHKDGSWWISQINLRPMGNLRESIYGNVSV